MQNRLRNLTASLRLNEPLQAPGISIAAQALISEEVDFDIKKDFLLALAAKGETAEEVAAFAAEFRSVSKEVPFNQLSAEGIDVCGTGGDRSGMFNVSTVVSMILAAAGVPVFKHGNRSITSKCGSADLLEELGFDLEAGPELQKESMEKLRFVFLFAPAYHPAFKAIMPVRRALADEGKRTIFNILGPLINPAKPAMQLLGVYHSRWVTPIASALGQLGLRRGVVVSSQIAAEQFADELSCAGDNHVAVFGDLKTDAVLWKPEDFGLERCGLDALAGGDRARNVTILHDLMDGKASKGLEDTIAWNAGTALWIAGQSDDVIQGIDLARTLLTGGKLREWLASAEKMFK